MAQTNKIIIVWFLIEGSFLLASYLLPAPEFFIFDGIWRITIILGVIILGKVHLLFSLKQWIYLIGLFVLNFVSARLFFPLKPFAPQVIGIVLGPLAEELLFRGWILDYIDGSNKYKIVTSSLLFGVYHIKNFFILTHFSLIYQILFATIVIGPIFALIRLKTNSLFHPIVLHGLNNTIGLTLTEKFLPFITKRKLSF